MATFKLTRKASRDLREILDYTATTWSREQADKYYAKLISTFRTLADNPALGRKRDDISEGMYGLTAEKHILFYRIASPEEIHIMRILHGRMDLKKRIYEDN